MVNIIFFSLVIRIFACGAAEPVSPGTGLHIKEGKISVELTNAPLPVLVRQIEAQGGIWFKARADIAGEKISVRFADIPLAEGLKRILRGMNHSLVYNAEGRVAGVYLLGNGEKNQGKSTPAKVRVNLRERRPSTAASGPNENITSVKIFHLRPANPFNLPRTTSHVRAKTFDMSLNLRNRVSAQ